MDKLWFLAEVEILQDLAPADLEQGVGFIIAP